MKSRPPPPPPDDSTFNDLLSKSIDAAKVLKRMKRIKRIKLFQMSNEIEPGDILLFNWGGPKIKGRWVHAEIAMTKEANGIVFTSSCFGGDTGCNFFKRKRITGDEEPKKGGLVRVYRFFDKNIAQQATHFICEILKQRRNYTNLAKLCLKATRNCFTTPDQAKKLSYDKIQEILKGTARSSMYCSEIVALVWLMALSVVDMQSLFPVKHIGACKPFNLDELKNVKGWRHVGDFTDFKESAHNSSWDFVCSDKNPIY